MKLSQSHGNLFQTHFFFQNYGGLNFLLHCDNDSKFLKESEIPFLYRQTMVNFPELRTLYQYNGQGLILFDNKDILINGKSFFLPEWKEKGVVFIHVLDHSGKLLPFNAFQTKLNKKYYFLSYLQVVSAIPKHLLQKSRSLSTINRFIDDNTTFQLSPSSNIDLYNEI